MVAICFHLYKIWKSELIYSERNQIYDFLEMEECVGYEDRFT
jgi:hypothetical protein